LRRAVLAQSRLEACIDQGDQPEWTLALANT
jgi:hypothetical protein